MSKGSPVGMYAGVVDAAAFDVWMAGAVCTRRCFGAVDIVSGEMVRNGAAAETRVGMELGIAELCVGMDIDGRPKHCAPDAFVSRLLALCSDGP